MSTRRRCAGCDGVDLVEVLDLGASPLADDFKTSASESMAMPTYPLRLLQCHDCTLVQQAEVVDDEVLWGGEYAYYTSTSPTLVRHFEDYAADMLRIYGSADAFVVEIGSNDGTLLAAIQRGGPRVLGIDPARGPAELAIERGVPTLVQRFGREVGADVRREYGAADMVIANNVIAHVSDLDDFVGGIDAILSPGGEVFLEFQYLPDLVLANAFDMVYHEHRYHFTLRSLDYALRARGFYVVSAQHVGTQGGSMRVRAARAGKRYSTPQPVAAGLNTMLAFEVGLDLDGLQYAADTVARRLRETLEDLQREGVQLVGWGAPAKATTLLAFTGIARYLDFVIERSPSKIGRYMPGTNVPVEDEDKIFDDHMLPHAALVALSWNMLPRLIRTQAAFIDDGGRIVVPFPVPIVI